MISAFLWYIVLTAIGWWVFPLAFRLFPRLPDRGLAFARSLGLLLWGYLFWLFASLGILRNDIGGLLLPLAVLLVGGYWVLHGGYFAELRQWIRTHLNLIVSVEILFLLAFVCMAWIRAANPEIMGTEKPMELAFINAILKSPTFPPHDPWLSGYSISYYYFGYVLVAMLAKLTGVPGSIAFNLGISSVFALSAIGAYGLVYNLLNVSGSKSREESDGSNSALSLSFLGPIFVLLVSNVEGFLHVLHTRGFFWHTDASGQPISSFWRWLDIVDLNQPPAQPLAWVPTRFWWWWRASRVVQDYDFSRGPREIIDEFPVFSYLLADLHPHVLAMPFAFLAMGLALSLFLTTYPDRLGWLNLRMDHRTRAWVAAIVFAAGFIAILFGLSTLSLPLTVIGVVGMLLGGIIYIGIPPESRRLGIQLFQHRDLGETEFGLSIYIDRASFLIFAVVLGGLAFLNTWDMPFYLVLFAGAYLLRRAFSEHPEQRLTAISLLKDFFSLLIALGVASILLYLPFYLGFSSQAGGIIPNLIYPTRGSQLWVMFATLFLPVLAYLIYLWRYTGKSSQLKWGFVYTLGLIFLLWALSWLFALVVLALPVVNDLFMGSLAAPGGSELFMESFIRRISTPGGLLTCLVLLGFAFGILLSSPRIRGDDKPPSVLISSPHIFAVLLVVVAGLLLLGPEFFFLRDQFGWRINTIFKFYFIAWLMLAVVAAFGSATLLVMLKRAWAVIFRIGLFCVLIVGLTYTLIGLSSKTNGFQPPQGYTLDGTAYLEVQIPDDMSAIRWLQTAPLGVVAEAVGGSYSEYARVATYSGQPNVLGWPGHESQWRGGSSEIGSRQVDLERLYCTRSWDEAYEILQRYDVRYIYIGSLERSSYVPNQGACPTGLSEDKFWQNLQPVYEQGGVTIFIVPSR